MINFELRFPIYKLIGGEVFIDGGQLTDKSNSISFNNIRWGKGFGVTIKTPFGPVRLDYSNPFNNRSFGDGKLNLGLLYIF